MLPVHINGPSRRVLKPGNTGLAGSVPSGLPYPLLMATSEGPYQPIKSGTLGACCIRPAGTDCSVCSLAEFAARSLAAVSILGEEDAPAYRYAAV